MKVIIYFSSSASVLYLYPILTAHVLQDLVRYRSSNRDGQTDLIIFCSGGFKNLDPAKSEG